MDSPEIIAAKRLAAGPLGQEHARVALLYTRSVTFGLRPVRGRPPKINTASAILLDLGQGPFALTCHHVLDEYRSGGSSKNSVFQIANTELDLDTTLIDQSPRLDLASIRLTSAQVRSMSPPGEIGCSIYTPSDWPHRPPSPGDFVAFGGFPGKTRTVKNHQDIDFTSWSVGASLVNAASDFQIVSSLERRYWVSARGGPDAMTLDDLGGMSGCPALVHRRLPSGLWTWDLVGVLRSYSDGLDTVYFSPLTALNADGTLVHPP